ncbi:MAG: PQQ-binding-like beta-propeller repeat protein [Planctomycetota bacterium]|jgi:outer membrane protein assembly factor BamB|nr:PQQ-binding-like beta-propeller repeat protein [Planctomycetota bacterium]
MKYLFIILISHAAAEDAPKDIARKSLPLRTALHHDPSLSSPLEQLVKLYRDANRLDELVTIYRTHVARYPADTNANAVLIRIQLATGDPEAAQRARIAVEQNPQNAYLSFLQYQSMKSNHPAESLDALDKAIELTKSANRRRLWLDKLMEEATANDRVDLLEKHLKKLAEVKEWKPEEAFEIARKLNRLKLYKHALQILKRAEKQPGAPETMVEVQLSAARAEAGLKQQEQAAQRLERLLKKVTSDYWRRPEILRRRLDLVSTDEEREQMIAASRAKLAARPADETAILDLAELLRKFDFRRDALKVLHEGIKQRPESARIEKTILDILDRLRDERGKEEFLALRLESFPERSDLAMEHLKTLFQLGRRKEAVEKFTTLAKTLPEKTQTDQQLELARFLRRSSLLRDAVPHFEKVVKAAPDRLDVRRELAETYIAISERTKARELFAAALSQDAEIENLLDIVQFMMDQKMYEESGTALKARLKKESHFDVRLLLITVEGKLGHFTAGERLIVRSRKFADTGARYRRWLEAAITFHDQFGSLETFLEKEHERMETEAGEWTKLSLERHTVFAEVAAKNDRSVEVADMLRGTLDSDITDESRVRIRKQLVEILEGEKGQELFIEQQLRILMQEDPGAKNEYKLRLALLHSQTRRNDLALRALSDVRIAEIKSPALLYSAEKIYRQQNRPEKVAEILERLIMLDSTNRDTWEKWLTVLATTDREERLRATIRKLLAGIEKMPLEEEVQQLLQQHLADSHWRTIGRLMKVDDEESMKSTLVILDATERSLSTDSQWLWLNWTRAYILNRLSRMKARDEAISELERVVGVMTKKAYEAKKKDSRDEIKPPSPDESGIQFPDGLTIMLPHARKLLTSPPVVAEKVRPTDRSGPLTPMRALWQFERDRSPITSILPLGTDRVLMTDLGNGLYCVGRKSGKLIWERSGSSAYVPATGNIYHGLRRHHSQQGMHLPMMPVSDGKGRIFLPHRGEIECISSADGRELWTARVSSRRAARLANMQRHQNQRNQPRVSMFTYRNLIIGVDPTQNCAAGFDTVSGKLVWEHAFKTPNAGASWMNSGATLRGDLLFMYGLNSAAMDAGSGKLLWSFQPARVRKFPIKLSKQPPVPAYMSSSRSRSYGYQFVQQQPYSRSRYGGRQAPLYINLAGQGQSSVYWSPLQVPPAGTVIASSGTVWTSPSSAHSRFAIIDRSRLLLFGQRGLYIFRLDLPMESRFIHCNGTYIGTAAGIVSLLSGSNLMLIDIEKGTTKTYSISVSSGQLVRAAVDGARIYISGPTGIECLNARTAKKIFVTRWPTSLGTENLVHRMGYANYYWKGCMFQNNPQQYYLRPTVSVRDGVMYTTVAPNQVVALSNDE